MGLRLRPATSVHEVAAKLRQAQLLRADPPLARLKQAQSRPSSQETGSPASGEACFAGRASTGSPTLSPAVQRTSYSKAHTKMLPQATHPALLVMTMATVGGRACWVSSRRRSSTTWRQDPHGRPRCPHSASSSTPPPSAPPDCLVHTPCTLSRLPSPHSLTPAARLMTPTPSTIRTRSRPRRCGSPCSGGSRTSSRCTRRCRVSSRASHFHPYRRSSTRAGSTTTLWKRGEETWNGTSTE